MSIYIFAYIAILAFEKYIRPMRLEVRKTELEQINHDLMTEFTSDESPRKHVRRIRSELRTSESVASFNNSRNILSTQQRIESGEWGVNPFLTSSAALNGFEIGSYVNLRLLNHEVDPVLAHLTAQLMNRASASYVNDSISELTLISLAQFQNPYIRINPDYFDHRILSFDTTNPLKEYFDAVTDAVYEFNPTEERIVNFQIGAGLARLAYMSYMQGIDCDIEYLDFETPK